jgi:hypothetical protein
MVTPFSGRGTRLSPAAAPARPVAVRPGRGSRRRTKPCSNVTRWALAPWSSPDFVFEIPSNLYVTVSHPYGWPDNHPSRTAVYRAFSPAPLRKVLSFMKKYVHIVENYDTGLCRDVPLASTRVALPAALRLRGGAPHACQWPAVPWCGSGGIPGRRCTGYCRVHALRSVHDKSVLHFRARRHYLIDHAPADERQQGQRDRRDQRSPGRTERAYKWLDARPPGGPALCRPPGPMRPAATEQRRP